MNPYILLLLVSAAFAMNASSSLSNSVPTCAGSQAVERGNPRPVDCLNLATFILATTADRSRPIQFSGHPSEGQIELPYTRSSGTCELFVIIANTDPYPGVPVTSSFDEVLSGMLDIVGVCLLNNIPEAVNFGGVTEAGVSGRLTIGICGLRRTGGNGGLQGNKTLDLGDIDLWMQSITQS